MAAFREVTTGLRFPEGPVALPEGSALVVEIERRTLTRVSPDGATAVVARPGGGPNGAAIGPDGRCHLCNNGGFEFHEDEHGLRPVRQADDYAGGRIERVDPTTGAVEVLYTEAEALAGGRVPLKGPNDIVFDGEGGFYFTDLGKVRARDQDRGAVFYGRADGSSCKEVAFPMVTPNGVGLSPDGAVLYVAETEPGRPLGVRRRRARRAREAALAVAPRRRPRRRRRRLPALRRPRRRSREPRATSASRPRSTAASPSWRRTAAASSSTSRSRTSTRPTSASAARTCGRPTSRSRTAAPWWRWTGRARGCRCTT